jgi:hypothetical protein
VRERQLPDGDGLSGEREEVVCHLETRDTQEGSVVNVDRDAVDRDPRNQVAVETADPDFTVDEGVELGERGGAKPVAENLGLRDRDDDAD